jgi:hypothetical protein
VGKVPEGLEIGQKASRLRIAPGPLTTKMFVAAAQSLEYTISDLGKIDGAAASIVRLNLS